MGTWNIRRVRLQKQLNHFARAMGGGQTGKKAVAAAIVRHRTAFGPKSKAVAFWRGGYVYRDGKFYATGSTKNRRVQFPTGRTGAGSAGILRQNRGLTRGLKTTKGTEKKANKRQILFTIPGASIKAIKGQIRKSGVPKSTGNYMKSVNQFISGNESFKKYAKRNADARVRSERSKRAANAKKARIAKERALSPAKPKKRTKK